MGAHPIAAMNQKRGDKGWGTICGAVEILSAKSGPQNDKLQLEGRQQLWPATRNVLERAGTRNVLQHECGELRGGSAARAGIQQLSIFFLPTATCVMETHSYRS